MQSPFLFQIDKMAIVLVKIDFIVDESQLSIVS